MKLLLCTKCSDVIKLVTGDIRTCSCGNASGIYENTIIASIFTKSSSYAILGFNNNSLVKMLSINQQEIDGDLEEDGVRGIDFDAFIIRERFCDTINHRRSFDDLKRFEKIWCGG